MNDLSEPARKQAGEPAAEELPEISKRAARRLLRRAFVLVGRDRTVRQHIREARVTTLWTLEDWGLEWTVQLDRGKVHFDRRPARGPHLTFTWPNGEEFFQSLWAGQNPDAALVLGGDLALRRYADPVYGAFCRLADQVLHNPFDDTGDRLW